MRSALSASPPFHTRYGFSRPEEPPLALQIDPYPEICHRGVLRPTVLASAIDIVASLHVRELSGTDATFTSDLSLRAPRREIPDRIDVRGRVLRTGKRLVTTAVYLEVAGASFGYGESTFTRLARPSDDGPSLDALMLPRVIDSNPLAIPLVEEVGIETLAHAADGVRLVLRDAHRNPEGILQGALVALLVEAAALARADRESSIPQIVAEMDLRYLAAARVGPIEGRATRIDPGEPRMLRVELRDMGQENRMTTSALVRLADAPEA